MTHLWIHNGSINKEIEDLIYELTDEQSVNPSSVWLLISKLPQQSSQLLAMNQRLALRIDELSRQGNKQEIVIALLEVKLAVLTDDVIALHNLPQNNGYIAP